MAAIDDEQRKDGEGIAATPEEGRSEAVDPLVGRLIAERFQILDRIAAGGMGVVYRAEQMPLGRVIALKVLETGQNPELKEDFKRRFFLEAAAASKLSHQNTVVVHDYGQDGDDIYFIAVEYLNGGTLHRYLKKKGPLRPAQAIHVGAQVCASLADAHHAGLVHRDVKPGNVMFAPRRKDPFFVKVVDFGLVKIITGDDRESMGLTQSGVMMGSPRYMAPEQVRALEVDHRTDIYAFGATLYHMVAGKPPFHSGKAFDAMAAHVSQRPPPLREIWADCPASPRLEAVITRCLEKDPANRFQSMDDVHGALMECAMEVQDGFSSGPTVSYTGLPMLRAGEEDSDPSADSLRALAAAASEPGRSGPRQITIDSDIPTSAAVPPPAKRRLGWLAVTIAAAAMMCGAAVAIGVQGDADEVQGASSTPAPEGDELAAPLDGSEAEPDEAPSVAATDEADEADEATPAPAEVELTSDPPGATVRRGDEPLGSTPVSLAIPDDEAWQLTLTRDGHRPRDVTVRAGDAPRRAITLDPLPRRATRSREPPARPTAEKAPPPPEETPEPRRPRVVTPDLPNPWD